jgi:hypothetical protein
MCLYSTEVAALIAAELRAGERTQDDVDDRAKSGERGLDREYHPPATTLMARAPLQTVAGLVLATSEGDRPPNQSFVWASKLATSARGALLRQASISNSSSRSTLMTASRTSTAGYPS